MPLFHIHGLIAGVLAPLSAGGRVFCTPGFDALKFFGWAFANGAKQAEELDYIPMPKPVVELIKKSWAEIKGADGKALAAH